MEPLSLRPPPSPPRLCSVTGKRTGASRETPRETPRAGPRTPRPRCVRSRRTTSGGRAALAAPSRPPPAGDAHIRAEPSDQDRVTATTSATPSTLRIGAASVVTTQAPTLRPSWITWPNPRTPTAAGARGSCAASPASCASVTRLVIALIALHRGQRNVAGTEVTTVSGCSMPCCATRRDGLRACTTSPRPRWKPRRRPGVNVPRASDSKPMNRTRSPPSGRCRKIRSASSVLQSTRSNGSSESAGFHHSGFGMSHRRGAQSKNRASRLPPTSGRSRGRTNPARASGRAGSGPA